MLTWNRRSETAPNGRTKVFQNAVGSANTWTDFAAELADFWIKLLQEADRLFTSDTPPSCRGILVAIRPDTGEITGYLASQDWKLHDRRLFVTLQSPFIEAAYYGVQGGDVAREAGIAELVQSTDLAIRRALSVTPVHALASAVRQAHGVELWLIDYDDRETIRPLGH